MASIVRVLCACVMCLCVFVSGDERMIAKSVHLANVLSAPAYIDCVRVCDFLFRMLDHTTIFIVYCDSYHFDSRKTVFPFMISLNTQQLDAYVSG